MAKIEDILNQRLTQKEKRPKMAALAQQSMEGNLTSFTGIFGKVPLKEKEKQELADLLQKYTPDNHETASENFSKDLNYLINLTSEVKAINNQAAILHGERIKKVQDVLKNYREGAFSAWLMTTYGNRQTPYNFLQYYEFYAAMPKHLHSQIEAMPRQAIYTLASRQGPFEKKQEIIRNYQGETKDQVLSLIRTVFPLSDGDGRRERVVDMTIGSLRKMHSNLRKLSLKMTNDQRIELLQIIHDLQHLVNESN